MAFQKRYFYLLLISCVVLTVFSGCNTIPLTEEIFNELRNYPTVDEYGEPKDPKKPEDLQYRVSKNITLKLNSTPPPALTTDYLGNLIKYNWTVREKVTISSNDLGKLLSDKNGYLVIGFEENNPECFLVFGRLPEKNDDKYYLILDKQKDTIRYGDDDYNLYFSWGDLPYLKIKKEEISLKYKNYRQVPGWPAYR